MFGLEETGRCQGEISVHPLDIKKDKRWWPNQKEEPEWCESEGVIWGWTDGCSYREPWFSLRHPHSSSFICRCVCVMPSRMCTLNKCKWRTWKRPVLSAALNSWWPDTLRVLCEDTRDRKQVLPSAHGQSVFCDNTGQS